MKEYKSNKELIEYLESKNVRVINKKEALSIIDMYSYYSIVNSYKDIFKDSNKENCYKFDVTFEEIYSLYQFDKNLKYIFLKYTLEIETNIKALIANQVAFHYGLESYLDEEKLDNNASIDNRKELILKINHQIEDDYKAHSAITHYKDKYGFIPPFVLTKVLTFGLLSRYYGLLEQSDRQAIAKKFKLSDNVLKQILKNLTFIRNISAHMDRIYSFRSKHYIKFKLIDKKYASEDKSTNLYMMIKCMEKLLSSEYATNFKSEINKEISNFEHSLNSVDINDVLNIMGFPVNKSQN